MNKAETPQNTLIPVRMINEYVYCPRLAYLEWVQAEWAESSDTIEGGRVHKKVDQPGGSLPEAADLHDEQSMTARSVMMSSEKIGVIARFDIIEADHGTVIPVDYKKGKRPHTAKKIYDPERVQLCLQGMILAEQGYRCPEGIIYFHGSRERVKINFDDELVNLALSAVDETRKMAAKGVIPEPLADSPKCPRCSLVEICLPDEIHFFKQKKFRPRAIAVKLDDVLPVYVQSYRAKVAKKGEELDITVDGQPTAKARLSEISQLVLMGNVYLTTPAMHELLRRGIPVSWCSFGGWFLGHSTGSWHKNIELRTAQYKISFDKEACLKLAGCFIKAKILNCRTLMRRNWRGEGKPEGLLISMKEDAENVERASSLAELLGIEGAAAARYFKHFSYMIKQDNTKNIPFNFKGRNRRPPTDPVNALLSFGYAMLVRSWTVTLNQTGFDPYRGFYHQPRYGRPALALDLMEAFRPVIVDSCVIRAINNGEIKTDNFICSGGATSLKEPARKKFIKAFERRMSEEIIHPVFGYKTSYRRILELQARLLGRFLLGEIDLYPDMTTR